MKRRADYILEKIIFDTKVKKNNPDNNNVNIMEVPTISIQEKSTDGVDTMNNTDKENIIPCNSSVEDNPNLSFANQMEQIVTENTPEKENNISTNCSSVIENSPDRSILYYDAKSFPLYNTKDSEAHKSYKFTKGCVTGKQAILPSEIEIKQTNRSRDLSSTSSSSSSGSSRSSSTSFSSSSNTSSKNEPNILVSINGPSTSQLTGQVSRRTTAKVLQNYSQSPINSNESDVDISDSDPMYTVDRTSSNLRKTTHLSSSSSISSSNNSVPVSTRRSRKRTRDPSKWKQNLAKLLRNTGKPYVSCTTKKEVPARCIKDACKCRLKCPENINDTDRITLFETYWSKGNIDLQRAYIRSCMMEVNPRYKYTNAVKPRLPNNAFYFTINNSKIRVCKNFFINTLGICDRQIRTVKKKTDPQSFVSKDMRGKHVSRKPIDPLLIENIKQHINSIPRIESHYLRASTSREYISGEKTIMDLWKDFDKLQKEEEKPTCDYWLYYNIFNKEFNISFFQPKKDRCDLCLDYEEANPSRKIEIKEKYENHLKEKDLCREEKRLDRQNINEINICAVYDLQAVMQCPTGETSSFFYKSKLNCLNFTIVEMSRKSEAVKKRKKSNEENENKIGAYSNVYCYFWDEVQGKRGANEIGSCILDYLKRLNDQNPNKTLHITFYSDNCCGQNKNKYITSLYSYVVNSFKNIHTITHKYLIKGHTQNEGDNVHSLIEKEIKRNKRSGPIYTPYQYVTLIKNSRKNGKPFNVMELTYNFFVDLKILQEKWGYNFSEDEHKSNVLWSNVKVLKFCKMQPFTFNYKTSYIQNEFTMVNMRNKRKKMDRPEEITLTKAYLQKLELSERKKNDLRDLINKNLIPSYYADYYNSIF